MKPIALVLSCEHAVNTVPECFRYLFHQHEEVLQTHRAIDLGALKIANHIHQTIPCDFTHATISRLLIDCNRSLTHRQCFSEFSNLLPAMEKQNLINQYYHPYRQQVESFIQHHLDNGAQVLHISIHSFTPVFNGNVRNACIGLLYDYTRHGEQEVARIWKGLLNAQDPSYRVRMNYPYHGKTDGFTTALRKKHSEQDYLGLEIESNNALLTTDESLYNVAMALSSSLKELLLIL